MPTAPARPRSRSPPTTPTCWWIGPSPPEELNRFEDAEDDLTRALDADPRRAETLVLRASAWRHLGQLDLAQDDIDRSIAIDPENAEALLERGILRERRNDWDGARRDWEQAIILAPNSATADLAEQNLALLEAGPAAK